MKKVLITLTASLVLMVSNSVFANGEGRGGPRGDRTESAAVGAAIVTFEGSQTPDELKTVPDVVAPGLVTTMTETCMGSTSAGVAWLGFGITGGTTWVDEGCRDRLDARQFGVFATQLKEPKLVWAGVELMCDGRRQEALARAGVKCGAQEASAPEAEAEPVAAVIISPGISASDDSLPAWFANND